MACYEMPKYKTKNMFYRVTWEVNKSLASLFYVTKGKYLSKIFTKNVARKRVQPLSENNTFVTR